jgi:hypothetical protein
MDFKFLFEFSSRAHNTKYYVAACMLNHVANLIVAFNLIKVITFYICMLSKYIIKFKFSYFKMISNFRVLQFYPLKRNLILEIRTMLTQIVVGMLFSDPLLFPK